MNKKCIILDKWDDDKKEWIKSDQLELPLYEILGFGIKNEFAGEIGHSYTTAIVQDLKTNKVFDMIIHRIKIIE